MKFNIRKQLKGQEPEGRKINRGAHYSEEIFKQVHSLRGEGFSFRQIWEALKAEGFKSEAKDEKSLITVYRRWGKSRKMMHLSCVFISLSFLLNVPTSNAATYARPRWARVQGCRDTRAMVLANQCSMVTWKPRAGHPEGCTVAQATCKDLYSGAEVSTDTAAQALQVDHVFPAHIAWIRRAWTAPEWIAFFNDMDNLLVTRARTNERKSDLMPGEWCPASRGARMLVATRIKRTADKYGLKLTEREAAGLQAWKAGECLPGSKNVD